MEEYYLHELKLEELVGQRDKVSGPTYVMHNWRHIQLLHVID